MKPQEQGRNRRGQFRPGVSGNPGGRPRGRPSVVEELRRIAATEAEYSPFAPEGETWVERIARRIVEGASNGDARLVAIVLDRLDGKPVVEIPEEEIEVVELPSTPEQAEPVSRLREV
jgi:hypothetical protein